MSFVELSKDSDCDVRRSAAGNPNTPVDVLVELSKDSDCDVRSSAAGNPNTPVDVLCRTVER
ncbi:HEAT repeat domain-containing protein [Bacteroides faecis]|uniref:HEAT repeat domain-containing protein n=1 Tax=Bacteroides faecis TaxID=674529 RepID=UPI0021649D08|nr:HEAT repeat domain-containing protein [Bacteroides faecis]UVS37015.1 HEAT repeat domain-containing protein [Bacteroides faecis]